MGYCALWCFFLMTAASACAAGVAGNTNEAWAAAAVIFIALIFIDKTKQKILGLSLSTLLFL